MTSTTTGNAASQVRVVVRPPYPHPSPPNGRGAPTSSGFHGRRRRRVIVDFHLLEFNGLSIAKGAPAHLLQRLALRGVRVLLATPEVTSAAELARRPLVAALQPQIQCFHLSDAGAAEARSPARNFDEM